jgi:hypothetical protein
MSKLKCNRSELQQSGLRTQIQPRDFENSRLEYGG